MQISTGIQEEPKSEVTLFKLKKGGLQGRDLKNNRMFNNFLIIEKKAKLKKIAKDAFLIKEEKK